jgi:hypothetical protein
MSIPSALTDGGGVSAITGSKVLKDYIADFLMTGTAAIIAVGVTSVDQALAAPTVVATAIIGAAISATYRIILRWATSD